MKRFTHSGNSPLRAALLLFALASTAAAHMMSMSSGELRVEGSTAVLEFQMPGYEVADLETPEATLLNSFTLRSGDVELPRSSGQCAPRAEDDSYRCRAEYPLPTDADELEVECRLVETTVPNHVHVLRAVRGDEAEQKVFDYAFRKHAVRFRPPSLLDEVWTGAARVLLGPAQLLFVLALALAGRSPKETVTLGVALVVSQPLVAIMAQHFGWEPPARFVEAAGALTIAYLATETLLLPDASARWLVAAGMGAFHGLYFAQFLSQTQTAAPPLLTGAALAEAALLAIFAAVVFRLRKDFGPVFDRVTASLLLVVGLGWFAYGIWG